jgi:RNA polymerase sigma factor for flagellar operon FliA
VRTTQKDRQRLVDANVPFVRSIAAKIKEQLPREIEFDDLVAYGMQGLLEAAERFDGSHGTSFTTFAYYRVRGAMFDGLRGMGWLPRAEYARLRFEERASAYLANLADRDAGAASSHHDDPLPAARIEDEVRAIAEALGGVAAIFVTTMDARREEAESGSATPVPQQQVERSERNYAIRRALDSLPEKERRLLELYYYEDRTLLEAGQALGLSKSWSSRLHARAITLLKLALEKFGVQPEQPILPPTGGKRRAKR